MGMNYLYILTDDENWKLDQYKVGLWNKKFSEIKLYHQHLNNPRVIFYQKIRFSLYLEQLIKHHFSTQLFYNKLDNHKLWFKGNIDDLLKFINQKGFKVKTSSKTYVYILGNLTNCNKDDVKNFCIKNYLNEPLEENYYFESSTDFTPDPNELLSFNYFKSMLSNNDNILFCYTHNDEFVINKIL